MWTETPNILSGPICLRTIEAGISEKAILGGVTTIQLREKNLSNEEFISIAKDVKKVCQKYHIPLIINDNLEVALAINSDGIHIGQNDIPASIVRKQIGPDKILGPN